jgi:type I restriction enzyme, S subunit
MGMTEKQELPDGWAEATIGDIVVQKVPQIIPSEEAYFNYIDISSIDNVSKEISSPKQLFGKDAPSRARQAVSTGDVLVSMTRPNLNAVAIVPDDLDNSIASTGFDVLRAIQTEPRWLFHHVQSLDFIDKMSRLVQGALYPAIKSVDVRGYRIPVPPINEQKRIGARIEELQAHSQRARGALETIPDLLDQLRQSILAAAFRGDLTKKWRQQHPDVQPASELLKRVRTERRKRWEESELEKLKAKGFTGDQLNTEFTKRRKQYKEPVPVNTTDLPELPEGWCWVSWSEVGFCQNGRAFPSKHYTDEGVRLLRPGNLHASGKIEWTQENTRWLPKEWANEYQEFIIGPQELVINLTAQSLKDEFLGRVCLSDSDEYCLLNQRIARLTPVLLPSQFCLWLFKAPVFRRFVDGLNTGSLIQHMFTSQVRDFVFPLPPLEEQEMMSDKIKAIMELEEGLLQLVSQFNGKIGNLDQSILSKAFLGELVPQDPNDEPASVFLERIAQEKAHQAVNQKSRKKERQIDETAHG